MCPSHNHLLLHSIGATSVSTNQRQSERLEAASPLRCEKRTYARASSGFQAGRRQTRAGSGVGWIEHEYSRAVRRGLMTL
jgi:hypothetical protein